DYFLKEHEPEHVYVRDRRGFSGAPCRVTMQEYFWLRLFDGRRTLRDIQAEAMHQASGELFPLERFTALAARLDDGLFLESPRFRARRAPHVRRRSGRGCYEGDAPRLRRQVAGLFTDPRGPGLPRKKPADNQLRAALIPHIDYHRGGHTFAWGFKEVA